jgi:hypothetical protein
MIPFLEPMPMSVTGNKLKLNQTNLQILFEQATTSVCDWKSHDFVGSKYLNKSSKIKFAVIGPAP